MTQSLQIYPNEDAVHYSLAYVTARNSLNKSSREHNTKNRKCEGGKMPKYFYLTSYFFVIEETNLWVEDWKWKRKSEVFEIHFK